MTITNTQIPKAKTASEAFLEWHSEQKVRHGLVDIKFYPGDLSKAAEDDFYKAANQMNADFKAGKFRVRNDL